MSIEKSKKNKTIPLIIEEDEADNQDIKKNSISDLINRIINSDSEAFLKTIPSDSIDLTVTSPPYDDIRDY